MATTFADDILYLEQRLRRVLPGRAAHRKMSPVLRERLKALGVGGRTCREGAVLALLFPFSGGTGLVLTKRPDSMSVHAGQISLPGGRREEGEELVRTALRETEEEIGVAASEVKVLGPMTPLYIPPTNYCVHPFVGYLDRRPMYRISEEEVERTIEVPLERLLDPSTRRQEVWTLRDRPVEVPYFRLGPETVWGATAMMLMEFVELFEDPAEAIRRRAGES